MPHDLRYRPHDSHNDKLLPSKVIKMKTRPRKLLSLSGLMIDRRSTEDPVPVRAWYCPEETRQQTGKGGIGGYQHCLVLILTATQTRTPSVRGPRTHIAPVWLLSSLIDRVRRLSYTLSSSAKIRGTTRAKWVNCYTHCGGCERRLCVLLDLVQSFAFLPATLRFGP